MYLEYFGLKEKPFSLSPDPKYLFYSRSHKEALAQMIYAASQDTGFMVLTGEVGTGKTILIHALMKQFPAYNFANIAHSAASPEGLIQNICKEFKLDFVNRTMTQLVLRIQDFLKWNYSSGVRSVLILDEAQNLGTATLEEIRLLSNFEAAHKKIIQIYLIGQPELEEKLWDENLRQLRSRISLKFRLSRLNREETKLYVDHRLRVSGLSEKRKLFDQEALEAVYGISKGIPRQINILCDNALLIAYSKLYTRIDASVVKKAGQFSQMAATPVQKLPAQAVPQSGRSISSPQNITPTGGGVKNAAQTVQAKPATITKPVTGNGNGAIDYDRIEEIMDTFAAQHRLFFMGRPKPGKLFFSILTAFIMLVLAFFLAILLAVELGILK